MRKSLMVFLGVVFVLLSLGVIAQQKDDPKCKDEPMFTRLPGFWIYNCDHKQFDAFDFIVGKGKVERVEGKLSKITYYPQASAKERASDLQIQRNFENAVQKIGGTVVWSEKGKSTFKVVKDGKEIWVNLWIEFTSKHGMTIVQREAMKQEVVATAEVFQNDIRSTGHAAVYGITFDTDSAAIRPESAQAIGEIAKLLKADPGLKIFVVGHTDGTGSVDHNLKLSQDRAQSVMQALTRDHGIAAARLRSYGCGQYAPVASNDTEEGRAKNRRVELVKQ